MKQKEEVYLPECARILNRPINLTMEEERDYIRRYQGGEINIGEKLLYAEYAQIKYIIGRYKNLGVPMEDLLQEACIGTLYAIKHFRPDYQVRFSTYAAYWIRQFVLNALNRQSGIVFLPRRMRKKQRELFDMANMIFLTTGKEATPEQLAKMNKMEVCEVNEILQFTILPVPLNPSFIEGENVFYDAGEPSADLIDILLSTLPKRERQILSLRYGICRSRSMTLEEVGKRLGVTAERVRKIEKKALHKLTHPARKKGLTGLWKV